MSTDYLPAREADLVTWVGTFSAWITATPTLVGLSAGQASTYATLKTAFVTAYNAANSDSTRTPAAIIAKNQAKDDVIANTRLLAGIIQKFPATTDVQRQELGLTVPVVGPTPVPPPAFAPAIDIVSVSGNTVTIRVHDSTSLRRGKPDGVKGMTVFSFVGENPPASTGSWVFEGSTTKKTTVDIAFPNTVAAGSKVWFVAFWFNNTAQSGPACEPVGTNLQGSSSMAA